MADYLRLGQHQQAPTKNETLMKSVLKAMTAGTVGGSMLLLSGLTLAGTIIALVVATPLLVIFSPVLVPAAIAVTLLVFGFASSGGFGLAALSVLAWMYRYLTGRHPPGADQLDHAKGVLASKARDIKESAQHKIEQVTGS
ncbi:Oleosin [Rhynchospora pubera]|uniref:Oleosin n=1 Tax=Rhynchospora pubera TaxID=906938 RepID=A0AAV8EHM3_9POAL|nr:Oleosin [Rhynchospora pubera]